RPVDLDAAAVRAVDRAGDDGLIAGRPAAEDTERLAAIFAEPRGVGLHDVFLEQPQKFLLLLGGCGAPIAAEHELPDARHIEIVAEQLAEARDPLRGRDARAEDLDRLIAEIGDKRPRILRVGLLW